jgi:hypothetical protein
VAERVRVREIDDDEGQRLVRIVRRGSGSVVTWRRAQMVLQSAQGMPVAGIAEARFTSVDRVLDDIVREGTRRMLAAALEAEVNACIAEFVGERDRAGRPGRAQRPPPTAQGHHRRRDHRGQGAAGQRQARKRADAELDASGG